MRWPIHVQLLVPVLSVVVLAIGLAGAASSYFGGLRARHQQEENLRRVVSTLTEAAFPLTEQVLKQMSGLSGAEFVLLDGGDRIEASTLRIDHNEAERLQQVPADEHLGSLSMRPAIRLGGLTYLGRRVPGPRRTSGAAPGFLVVLYQEDRWWGGVRQAGYPALIAGAVAAAAAVLVTTVLARRFVRPIQRLGGQTAVIAGGNFQPVAVPDRNDEIRDLALSINSMAEKLSQYEAEVRRSERLRVLGQLGAGMAHQLRNLATGAMMAVELHERECPAAGGSESMQVALRQLRLMESYLHRFLSLGRSRPASPAEVDLRALARDVLELLRPTCVHHKVELSFCGPAERLVVWGEAESLRELLVNLVLNAVEAARRPAGAPPRVIVEIQRRGDDRVVVRVMDTGPGPDAAIGQRLFEPFVGEKPEGTGLGLFVARQVAEAHQGSIAWERQSEMTCFTVELPLRETHESDGAPAGG